MFGQKIDTIYQSAASAAASKRIAAMPSSRGGSAVPTPQEQAVVEAALPVLAPSPYNDETYKIAEQGQAGLLPPHLQSVFNQARLNDNTPMTAALQVQALMKLEAEGWTSPMDVPEVVIPELDMVLVEEPKKISPMIYALGAGVLLLGGFLLFRN